MCDQSSADQFADEHRQVRRHGHHPIFQIFEQLSSILGDFDDLKKTPEALKMFVQLTNNLSQWENNQQGVCSDWGGYRCHHRLFVNVLPLRFEPQLESSEPNEMKRTWEQRCRTLAMSSSEISVPIEISAASFTCPSTSAGKISDRSRSFAFVR